MPSLIVFCGSQVLLGEAGLLSFTSGGLLSFTSAGLLAFIFSPLFPPAPADDLSDKGLAGECYNHPVPEGYVPGRSGNIPDTELIDSHCEQTGKCKAEQVRVPLR
jgi:hypothetical protein